MKARWNGEVVAESDKTLEVDGYRYFPRDSVRMELFKPAARTASDDACPHGVQFYDVGGSARAAWSYERPHGKMQAIDHWMGFWGDVEVGE